MKILYVEDDVGISMVAKMVFMNTSHDFLICHDPTQASRILIDTNIDLVILDLVFIGNETGIDVLNTIYTQKLSTKVIVFSGFADSHFASELLFYKNLNIILSTFNKPDSFVNIMREIDRFERQRFLS